MWLDGKNNGGMNWDMYKREIEVGILRVEYLMNEAMSRLSITIRRKQTTMSRKTIGVIQSQYSLCPLHFSFTGRRTCTPKTVTYSGEVIDGPSVRINSGLRV
jgi:hypothetical protein